MLVSPPGLEPPSEEILDPPISDSSPGGQGGNPLPPPVKINPKNDDHQRRQHGFHVSCPLPLPGRWTRYWTVTIYFSTQDRLLTPISISRKVHTRLKIEQLTCSWFLSGKAYFCRKRMPGRPGGRCVSPSHSGRSSSPPRSATRWCRTWTRTSRCPPASSLPSVPSAGRLLSAFPTLLLVECQGLISEA